MRKFYRYAVPAAAGVLLLGFAPAAMAGSGTTAQSVWAGFTAGDGVFGYTDKQTYSFDSLAAATHYANVLESTAAPTCSGSAANCGASNAPLAAPAAPAPDATKITPLVHADRCTFFTGGLLSGSTYTQSVTVNGKNGKGNWTYTSAYRITGQTVSPETEWSSVLDSSDGAHVTLQGEIAGESVLAKSAATSKYSFSLVDSAGASRVTGLSVTLTDPAGTAGTPTPIGSTVVTAADATNFRNFSVGTAPADPADLYLDTLVATNGNTALLAKGDARTILNTDSFAGNNNGGSDGSALAYARLDPTEVTLTEGAWTATLAGTVKDNAGTATTNLSVERKLVVVGLNNCATP
ncbi:hypothetical protein [Actinoplanes sp. NPDC049599]|uniref:hypothetical protein n=1 Tax=Actinoplanes sp. NPDC049599 TaxID=3363903 RepID=UPI0037AC01B8